MPEGVPVQPGSDDLKSPAYRDADGLLIPARIAVTQPGGEGTIAIPISAANPLPVFDSGGVGSSSGQSFDAFGRLRVSEPHTLFDSKQLYDANPLFWDESITNASGNASSVHNPVHAEVLMHVESGDRVIRQTFQRFNYQPGKSQMVMMTAVMGNPSVGVTASIGIYDVANGLFFQSKDAVMGICVRKDGGDSFVLQSSWNADKMDGTGPSGVIIDSTKTQILWIDFEWLGVGTVRFGFVVDGVFILAHSAHHANVLAKVYTSTPNLPVRYEIESSGPVAEMSHICSTVMTEGGRENVGVALYEDIEGEVNANSTSDWYAIMGIRLRSTHLGVEVNPVKISLQLTTNDRTRWGIFLNPAVAGAFAFADHPSSALQLALGDVAGNPSATTLQSLGVRLDGGYIEGRASAALGVDQALHIGSDIAGVRDELVLAVNPRQPGLRIAGGMGWNEVQ